MYLKSLTFSALVLAPIALMGMQPPTALSLVGSF